MNMEKKPSPPAVYTIILNYNNYSDTVQTLDSVFSLDYDSNSVLLVENSTDKNVTEKIRSRFPGLTVIENGKNMGYAGGNNVGIQQALLSQADYIFLLNNDVTLEHDVLKKCVSAMEISPGCAACQPLVASDPHNDTIWSAGTQLFFGYPRLFLKGKKVQKNGISPAPFGLVGCSILFRASALREIGLFDESLFLFHEETDWCIRARKKNFSLLVISDAVVYHKISTTIGLFSNVYLYYIGRNWLLVGKKNFGRFNYFSILATELFVRFPYYLFCLIKKGQPAMIQYYLRGIFDGMCGIAGEATAERLS
jgi:GT2 family glycosyltransferase